MPTISEILDGVFTKQNPTIFGYLPPSITYKGVRVPHWEFFVSRPDHPSSRIDSVLSSANGILNVVLSPVRSFVGAVLHPLFGLLDAAYDMVSDFIQSVFGRAIDLAYSVADTLQAGVNWAIDMAGVLANDVRNSVVGLVQFVQGVLEAAISAVKNEAETLYNQATDLARRVAADALGAATFALGLAQAGFTALVDAVRRDAVAWFNDAKNLAAQGLSDVRQWASDALNAAEAFSARALHDLQAWAEDAIRDAVGAFEALWSGIVRDVIDPIVHKLEDFLGNEWKAAKALLDVLEDAIGWIIWVTTHAIPEIEGVIDATRDAASLSPEQLVQRGARFVERLVA